MDNRAKAVVTIDWLTETYGIWLADHGPFGEDLEKD